MCIYIYISKYIFLSLYNFTCMFVFRTHHLVSNNQLVHSCLFHCQNVLVACSYMTLYATLVCLLLSSFSSLQNTFILIFISSLHHQPFPFLPLNTPMYLLPPMLFFKFMFFFFKTIYVIITIT